jgi:DNA-binding NarL/FixJ family response regulator
MGVAMADATNGPARVRVAVVDDDASVRELLRIWLEDDDRIELVGLASGGWPALRHAADWQADVILLDHHMPDGTGLEVLNRLRSWVPSCRVIIYTGYPGTVDAALAGGAAAVLEKSLPPQALLDRVVEIARS